MNVQRGDVAMVDWFFSDRTGSKRRPALVVQADACNTALDDAILALITGSARRRVGAARQLEIDIATPDGMQVGHQRRCTMREPCNHGSHVHPANPRSIVSDPDAEGQ